MVFLVKIWQLPFQGLGLFQREEWALLGLVLISRGLKLGLLEGRCFVTFSLVQL
jgi:hypothetical protein